MKTLTLCIILLACYSTLPAQNLQPQRTVVSGRIRNLQPSDNQIITVNYTDPITRSKSASRIAPDGTFHTFGNMHFTQNITVNYSGRFINLMVSPSDSLFIDIDMDMYRNGANTKGLTLSGKNNTEFNRHLPDLCNYIYQSGYDFPKGLSPTELITEFKKAINLVNEKIDNYAVQNNVQPEVVEWAKRDIVYVYANSIIVYYNNDTEVESRLKVFTDEIFDINNAKNFSSMMFPYHLTTVSSAIISSNKAIMEYLTQEDLKNGLQEALKTFMQQPANTSRDYMVYNFIKSIFEYAQGIGKLDSELIKSIPNGIFTDSYFVTLLSKDFQPASVQKDYAELDIKGVSYLDTAKQQVVSLPQIDFISHLARRYPNKAIYIDVYATWCGPCIEEMEPAKELKKLFVGKDVVFVYACLRSDQNKWQPTIDRHKITGEHYFFDADATEAFMSGYQLPGYPSYMLVDKQGNMVTTKAPRPSNITQTADAIDKLLK